MGTEGRSLLSLYFEEFVVLVTAFARRHNNTGTSQEERSVMKNRPSVMCHTGSILIKRECVQYSRQCCYSYSTVPVCTNCALDGLTYCFTWKEKVLFNTSSQPCVLEQPAGSLEAGSSVRCLAVRQNHPTTKAREVGKIRSFFLEPSTRDISREGE
jgi:hypothetical protein